MYGNVDNEEYNKNWNQFLQNINKDYKIGK